MKINKGMYRLVQEGLLANKLLAKILVKHGFNQTSHTLGLWRHYKITIKFTLVVDDFGIKY